MAESELEFDLVIPDAQPVDVLGLFGGLGYLMRDLMARNQPTDNRTRHLASLMERIIEHNTAEMRSVFLETEWGEVVVEEMEMPDEFLDKLGLEIVDGEMVDTDQ